MIFAAEKHPETLTNIISTSKIILRRHKHAGNHRQRSSGFWGRVQNFGSMTAEVFAIFLEMLER